MPNAMEAKRTLADAMADPAAAPGVQLMSGAARRNGRAQFADATRLARNAHLRIFEAIHAIEETHLLLPEDRAMMADLRDYATGLSNRMRQMRERLDRNYTGGEHYTARLPDADRI